MLQRIDELVRHVDLGQVRRNPCCHLHARHDEDTSEYLPAIVEVPPPLDERLRLERRLNEPEVRVVLPCWDGAAAASGDAERELGVRVSAGLCEHLSHREV